MLLKFRKALGEGGVTDGYYGQEINLTTFNLAGINMFLHGVSYDKFHLALGDTLVEPQHWSDEPFEAIVSNPPYSIKWEGDNNPVLINDPRYSPAGVLAPKSKADLAFTMHILSWLAEDGTAGIVEFPGVLYRGGAERKIRKYLVDNNYVDTVIQLPPDLFFGTTIGTCIIVLKKSKTTNDVLFIDASKHFERVGNKNKLTEQSQNTILEAIANREESEHYAYRVDNDKLAENDYNLSVSSYVEPEDTREIIDIKELIAEIESIVMRQSQLRDAIDEIVKDLVEEFVDSVTVTTAVDEAWPAYVRRKMAQELNRIIEGEKLKADATWDVVPAAFGSGAAYLGGAKIAKLLPPMSRFSRGGEDRKEKQSRVEQKLHELLVRFDPLFVEDGSAELMQMRGA